MQSLIPTLYLRRQRSTFADGLAALFDNASVSGRYDRSPSAEIADARAVAADFLITGDDLRSALLLHDQS
jgi:hypothetical protein